VGGRSGRFPASVNDGRQAAFLLFQNQLAALLQFLSSGSGLLGQLFGLGARLNCSFIQALARIFSAFYSLIAQFNTALPNLSARLFARLWR
jgi:hypothetical protein